MAIIRSVIRGVGAYLPKRVMTNDDLARLVDTTDEWIKERTGIEQRHIAEDGELTSDLGIAASRQALVRSGIDPTDIDLLICATATPDRTFPATAVKIQAGLGITKGAAFDVQAVCSGFIYGLNIADNFIKTGQSKRALGGRRRNFLAHPRLEGSRHVRAVRRRRGRRRARSPVAARQSRGSRHSGDAHPLAMDVSRSCSTWTADPAPPRPPDYLRMNGREVFRHAVQKISSVIEETLVTTGYAPGEIDLYVPHQANKRILDGIGKKLGIPPHKVVVTLAKHGNTSAASVPLALNQAFEDRRLREGSLVLMEAMGGGFTWGAVLARW